MLSGIAEYINVDYDKDWLIRMHNEVGDIYDSWIYGTSHNLVVPSTDYGQEIKVGYFKIYDKAENISEFSSDDLNTLGFDSKIIIVE